MRCARLWLAGLGIFAAAVVSPVVHAADPPPKPSSALTAEQLADRIDALIDAQLKANSVQAAALADDAEFFRRLSLDVGGRIPSVMDARNFLADKSPDKRHKAVDKLLDPREPRYPAHFAAVWRALMVPDNNNQFGQGAGPQLEAG